MDNNEPRLMTDAVGTTGCRATVATEQRKPRVVMRPCGPTCATLTSGGRCPVHAQGQAVKGRTTTQRTTTERGYGADWQKLRAVKLATDPFCELQINCAGASATEVDHWLPIDERPDLRLEWSNLRSACNPCHRIKTKQDLSNQKARSY